MTTISLRPGIAGGLRTLTDALADIAQRREHRRTIAALQRLDAHALCDLGPCGAEIGFIAAEAAVVACGHENEESGRDPRPIEEL